MSRTIFIGRCLSPSINFEDQWIVASEDSDSVCYLFLSVFFFLLVWFGLFFYLLLRKIFVGFLSSICSF